MADALTISALDCFYGETQVLHGLNLGLRQGEVHCLLGRNGAGKTTTLKAIMGLLPARAGSIRLVGTELTELEPHEVPKAGVAYVPQGRRLFAEMTVAENIEIGLMARGKGKAELIIRKGFRKAIDSYSAFFENDHKTQTGLAGYLRERGIRTVTIAGLATDFCVAYSALDSVGRGFTTNIRLDACRGIDIGGTIATMTSEMKAAGVKLLYG